MGAFVKGMVERPGLCVLAWSRGFKNWYLKKGFFLRVSKVVKTKRYKKRINNK